MMKYFIDNKLNLVIVILFLLFQIVEIFYLDESNFFIVELIFSIVFIILFELAYRHSKNQEARNKSLVKSLFLFFAILIAPITVTHFHNNIDYELNVFFCINIFILSQSIFYLFFCLKKYNH